MSHPLIHLSPTPTRFAPMSLKFSFTPLLALSEADITVLSEDGKPTHALRGILRLRSTYFRAMLDSGCREGQDGEDTIRLHNSLEAVRSLIFYLHTDRLEAPDTSLVELLEMAEMMNLPRLKTLACTEVI